MNASNGRVGESTEGNGAELFIGVQSQIGIQSWWFRYTYVKIAVDAASTAFIGDSHVDAPALIYGSDVIRRAR